MACPSLTSINYLKMIVSRIHPTCNNVRVDTVHTHTFGKSRDKACFETMLEAKVEDEIALGSRVRVEVVKSSRRSSSGGAAVADFRADARAVGASGMSYQPWEGAGRRSNALFFVVACVEFGRP
jgi:hypothetical protein